MNLLWKLISMHIYAYNHKLFGGASQKKAVKCYEQIILVLDQDERMNLPFISTFGRCYVPLKSA